MTRRVALTPHELCFWQLAQMIGSCHSNFDFGLHLFVCAFSTLGITGDISMVPDVGDSSGAGAI